MAAGTAVGVLLGVAGTAGVGVGVEKDGSAEGVAVGGGAGVPRRGIRTIGIRGTAGSSAVEETVPRDAGSVGRLVRSE